VELGKIRIATRNGQSVVVVGQRPGAVLDTLVPEALLGLPVGVDVERRRRRIGDEHDEHGDRYVAVEQHRHDQHGHQRQEHQRHVLPIVRDDESEREDR